MQRYNLTTEQLFPYQNIIQFEQETCMPVAKQQPASNTVLPPPNESAYTRLSPHAIQQHQQHTIVSSDDELNSNISNNNEGFLGFKSVDTARSFASSSVHERSNVRKQLYISEMDNSIKLMRISEQQQYLLYAAGQQVECRGDPGLYDTIVACEVGKVDSNEYLLKTHINEELPQQLTPETKVKSMIQTLHHDNIYEINSNSTTSSQKKKREERNKWLKEQLYKQEKLRDLQTAKIREFRELLNQRSINNKSNTNISTDSTISEFPASSPSNQHPLSNPNKYTPRTPLLKNTLPADAFERTLAIISAANTQITYSDKVNQWQCASDLSEVEDVRDFDLYFQQTELSRQQQRKARKRRYAIKSENMQPTPMYTLEQFCDMLVRQCKKKYATTPFTAMEHLHRQSRLHKTAFENRKYACHERSETSESTLDEEQHCNRRNKRKPSATQRRVRRISSPTTENDLAGQNNIAVLNNVANITQSAVPLKTPLSKKIDIDLSVENAMKEKWMLNAEEKSLFRFYKHHFDEQQIIHQQQIKQHHPNLEQPTLFKAPTLQHIKVECNAINPEKIVKNISNDPEYIPSLSITAITSNNEVPAQLLATTTPSQSDSSENMPLQPNSNANNKNISNEMNKLPVTSSNESRRSLPADFGVMHQQQEFCNYLGLTGLGMPNIVPINRSNSALTRRSLRVRMQQKVQPSLQNSQPKSINAHSNQQSLDESNLYMIPPYSQQSPMPSSERQSDDVHFLQSNVKRVERRQSLDYSNYTSESPKHSSQTHEEYGVEQLKRTYTAAKDDLLEGEKEACQIPRISTAIEPCTSKMYEPNKSIPIVQYKPNTKPEIKIICSIAATTKDDIVHETNELSETLTTELDSKEQQKHNSGLDSNFEMNNDSNGKAKTCIVYEKTANYASTTSATPPTTCKTTNSNEQNHQTKADDTIESTDRTCGVSKDCTARDLRESVPLKGIGKLSKLSPQDVYKCFQKYLLESRKNKPSICIVQTLPVSHPITTHNVDARSGPSFVSSLNDTTGQLESIVSNMPTTSTTEQQQIEKEFDHMNDLVAQSKAPTKSLKIRKKVKASFMNAPMNKLVTRSSRRKLRHSNRSKIAVLSSVTIKKPKPKRKPKTKYNNKSSNVTNASRITNKSEKVATEQNNKLSTKKRLYDGSNNEAKIEAQKQDSLSSSKNIKHVTADESENPLEERSIYTNSPIDKKKYTDKMEWLKRRRKSIEPTNTIPGSIMESACATTTTIKPIIPNSNNCNYATNTIIKMNPITLNSVHKSDSQVQTTPIKTKDQAIQYTPINNTKKMHYISAPSVMFENPLNNFREHGAVIYMYYEMDVLIVVQDQLMSFWKYSKIANLLLKSPTLAVSQQNNCLSPSNVGGAKRSEWCLLGKTKRILNDIEILSPYDNRICVHNSMPLYLELRCRQLPHGLRECKLLTIYVNVYYFHDEEMIAKVHSIPLDSVQGEPSKVRFTTLIDSRYFIMSWSHDNSLGKVITGFCKYSLTPTLDTLASIRGFKSLAHEITALECINEDKLIGFGKTQVTIWDHRSGDVLMNYDLNVPLGINLGCTYYPSFDLDNMIVLYQYKNSVGDQNCILEIMALDISSTTPSHRILHRHILSNNMLGKINNTINNGEQLIMTAQNNSEVWISCADPTTLTYVPPQRSRRYYSRGRNQIIEFTDDTLNVLAFTDYVLKLKVENN